MMRLHIDHKCNLAYASKQGKENYYECDTKYHKRCSAMKVMHLILQMDF